MDFNDFNDFIKSAPEIYHVLVSGILMALLSHLLIEYYIRKDETSTFIRNIWIYCYGIVLLLFFGKFSNSGYTMLDAFLPMYLIFYVYSIIVLKNKTTTLKSLCKYLMFKN